MTNGQNKEFDEGTIQIMPDDEQLSLRWSPVVRDETIALLRHIEIPPENGDTVRAEAESILSRCVPPDEESGRETGLVVGYVQSGKTLSFTTVAALARDNNYQMVIVIAGISKILNDQSIRRLRDDLRLDSRPDRKWRLIHNPSTVDNSQITISNIIDEWRDETVPEEARRTLLITLMKNHIHLNNLINVLRNVNLENTPILIVDDEADQAGLNNLIREGDESTTYQRLRELKDMIPHHTFLQYTATPQAPLLINLIDVLSPGFVVMLTPGNDYVGGRDFFIDSDHYIREIPQGDIPRRRNPVIEPPESLLQALRIFFLGVASGLIRDQGRGNRSMMIHPSRKTISHGIYHSWVTQITESWLSILRNTNDPDYQDILEDFRTAYTDLQLTVDNLESFEHLFQALLNAVRMTEIHLINYTRRRQYQIDWSATYPNILVGGQALDRGFTVEGLTVTYMPRGPGAGMADTIQQRARFFGYKRQYIDYCRVYVEQEIATAFRKYVRHEENMRRQLHEHSQSGRPLSELRRVFLLSRRLRPTRESVIDIDYVRVLVNEGWFAPKAPHDSNVANHLRLIDSFIDTLELVPDEGHPDRTIIQRHEVAYNVSLRQLYDNLLSQLQFARLSDAQNLFGVLVIIEDHLTVKEDATATLYKMSSGNTRNRRLNDHGEIFNLFQGAYPVNPRHLRGSIYSGDRDIFSVNEITVQIHYLIIDEFLTEHTDLAYVPNIAIRITREIAGDVIIQDQGNLVENNDE